MKQSSYVYQGTLERVVFGKRHQSSEIIVLEKLYQSVEMNLEKRFVEKEEQVSESEIILPVLVNQNDLLTTKQLKILVLWIWIHIFMLSLTHKFWVLAKYTRQDCEKTFSLSLSKVFSA